MKFNMPPLVILAIHMLCAFILSRLPGPKIPAVISNSLALVLALITLILIIPSVINFMIQKTTVSPFHLDRSNVLVDGGLYRFSRNPMYLGMLAMLIASIFYFHSFLALILVPCFVVIMNKLQIEPEEKALTELFGTEYRQYCDRVRRWI